MNPLIEMVLGIVWTISWILLAKFLHRLSVRTINARPEYGQHPGTDGMVSASISKAEDRGCSEIIFSCLGVITSLIGLAVITHSFLRIFRII